MFYVHLHPLHVDKDEVVSRKQDFAYGVSKND
jgi:hypothetical protein